jgi:hypothetical protein
LLLTAKNLRFQATPPDTAQTKTFLRWRRVETGLVGGDAPGLVAGQD